MTVLSVDLAYKSYADVGVCALRSAGSLIEVEPIGLPGLGLKGSPAVDRLAQTIADLAEQRGARLIFIDGPQAWKSPDTGYVHSRLCERALATQGKTGLPGVTKPANYAGFIGFSIELFDALTDLGWPRLPDADAITSSGRFALESFPTSAWRLLGLKPLPGKARTPGAAVREKLAELMGLLPISAPDDLTHDELQAVVAGLAGIAVEGHTAHSYAVSGVKPVHLEGTWREGFIVNPARATPS